MLPSPVQAVELLQDAAERCESASSGRAADAGAPPIIVHAESAIIAVDPLRIRQVIVNLVTNAREAMSGDEPVVLRGSREGDGYRIEVLDRGKGLSDEASERIFEPFFTTRRNGTGLGLAVCYGLVTAHGGTIRAETRPGGGTRFVVDLPGIVVDEESDSQEHA
jgi:signal transduction histidine kinase